MAMRKLGSREAKNFWKKVDSSGGDAACWEWQGARRHARGGYGSFRGTTAHRYAWAIANNRLPGKLFVCHSCDNPPCCNPAHLFLGTTQDNVDDCVAKRRHCIGERNGHAIINESDVVDIRNSRLSGQRIASKYGLSGQAVSNIRRGITWNHADGPTPDRRRGELIKGESNGRSKLTAADVVAIRRSKESYRSIAEEFRVSHWTISDIMRRKIWKHI